VGDAHLLDTAACVTLEEAIAALKAEMACPWQARGMAPLDTGTRAA